MSACEAQANKSLVLLTPLITQCTITATTSKASPWTTTNMSSPQPTMSSQSDSNKFDELRWVIQIRRTLEEELEDDAEVPVSIFNVPKALLASHPESYTPQEVALGPYHYWRPELYEMQRYKLAAAKRIAKQFQSLKFQNVVDQLTKLDSMIRACYHKYLDFNGETLAWMMAIDASFLLEFLQVYAVQEGKTLTRVSSRMSHLVDYAGTKSAHNAILRDAVMLENQIPLVVLRKMLEFKFSSLELADDMLLSMLTGLCKELSPFKLTDQDLQKIQVSGGSHLLDFLYGTIVPKVEEPSEITEVEGQNDGKQEKESSSADSSYVKQLLDFIWKQVQKLNGGPIRLIKKVLVSKPLKFILKLPWTILSSLPGLKILKQPVESLFSQNKEEVKPENQTSSSTNNISQPPSVDEIAIPSVTELANCGIRFVPTNGGISTIAFDAKTATFYLPAVTLDVNTEVVLRNLVAYEASNASGPLVFTRYTELMNGIIDSDEDAKILRDKGIFTRYTELMNGIIDSDEDAKILRDKGIILNRLKNDEEVSKLWNGMSKSVKLMKVPFLDKVIQDVNKHHSGRLSVIAGKFFKLYVFGSWQFLSVLAAICLLLLMALQSFCSVYSCSRTLSVKTTL
ncbi:hypothetical protein CJ030_MR3G026635 [Morella rubra]|uniref:Uncharacterized protein n=1 Tax=Morella rubra TaxID=262757 RepID=A0A6A1W0Z1_9ROSI|nr:hypothetical protein CJ030_MR3G026635 [Morella rubra]